MSFLDRLAGRWGYEKRSAEPSWQALASGGLGSAYSTRLAENVSTVAACVGAIASALATAPIYVYRRDGDSRQEVKDHPVSRLLHTAPNEAQTMPELLESWTANTLLSGNGLLLVERDGAIASGLKFVPWGWVTPQLGGSGRLVYDVAENGLYGAGGRRYRLLADDVAHLRDRSDDGLLGVSRLKRSQEVARHAHAINRRANAVVANGAAPTGIISTERALTPEQLARLRDGIDRGHTGDRAGRVMLLSDGLKFEAFQITPEDAELLASRKFSVEEIARIFAVPPPIVQDYSHNTFTNSQTAGRWFAQFTLAPWAAKIGAALTRALFPEGSGYEVEIDLSGYYKEDRKSRWEAHKIAVEAGILTADEIREIEGWTPRKEVTV